MSNDKSIEDELNEDFNELENEELLEEVTVEIEETTEISTENKESIENKESDDFEAVFKSTANKHKLEGTHTLQRDTILLGKKDEEDEEIAASTDFFDNTFNPERTSQFYYETNNNEDYQYTKRLTQDIYMILDKQTEIDFLVNRRKPNKATFNKYYEMCIEEYDMIYTKSELFVELSYYFTDNIFNMFKLLNKKNASGILLELKEKGHLNEISKVNFI